MKVRFTFRFIMPLLVATIMAGCVTTDPYAPPKAGKETALDRYVHAPDSSFAWKLEKTLVADDLTGLRHSLGPADRARVDDYLETVREVERRIQRAEADTAADSLPPDLERPLGAPAVYADHARLMFDLQVLA